MIQELKDIVSVKFIDQSVIELSVYVLDKQITARETLSKEDIKSIRTSLTLLRQTEAFHKALFHLYLEIEKYYEEEDVIREEIGVGHLVDFLEDVKRGGDIEVLILCYNVSKTKRGKNTTRVRANNIQSIEELRKRIDEILEGNDIVCYKIKNNTPA